MKKIFLPFIILFLAHTTFSAEVSHTIQLSDLKVIKAEATRLDSFLVLLNETQTSRVTISCTDGAGPLQSVVTIATFSQNAIAQTYTFGGGDFYCYAALKLTSKLKKNDMVNFHLEIDYEESRSKVKFAEVSITDGSASFNTKEINTFRWYKIP